MAFAVGLTAFEYKLACNLRYGYNLHVEVNASYFFLIKVVIAL